MLGTHDSQVHSISWSHDDSALITASADFTAKVWHVPGLPGSDSVGCSGAGADTRSSGSSNTSSGVSSSGGDAGRSTTMTLGSTFAAVSAAAAAGVTCTVLQHRCAVQAAELHPLVQPLLLAVTGGCDGALRLWDAGQGLLLQSVQVRCSNRSLQMPGVCAPDCQWVDMLLMLKEHVAVLLTLQIAATSTAD